jgi:hypothetical protein
MLDLESIRENNRSKINEPKTIARLMAQEFMVDEKVIHPVLVDRDHTCQHCVFLHKECAERMFDDLGSVIPDCTDDYPKSVIYQYK